MELQEVTKFKFCMRIAVSGAHGSFSEVAGKEYCRVQGIENPELLYLVTA